CNSRKRREARGLGRTRDSIRRTEELSSRRSPSSLHMFFISSCVCSASYLFRVSSQLCIRRPGRPSDLLTPPIRPKHDLPDERHLRLGVPEAVVRVGIRATALEVGVAIALVRVTTQVVTEQQSKLLGPTPSTANVNVRAWRPGRLAEVALGALGVV